MDQDSGGNPHIDHSTKEQTPLPEGEIDEVYVLVATHSNGGESIYGQMIGGIFTNFVTDDPARQAQMHELLHRQGTYEVAPKLGVQLVWRTYERA
jgi:hypothetical protein